MPVCRHTRFPPAIPAGLLTLTLSWNASAAPYKIQNTDPQSFDEINNVIQSEIPNDLNQAMCGGWNFDVPVNGVFHHQEDYCAPAASQDIGVLCRDKNEAMWKKVGTDKWTDGTANRTNADMDNNKKKTEQDKGMIPEVKNLPGRDIEGTFWNIQSGIAKRKDTGGLADYYTSSSTGFTYPEDIDTCGFTTVCRPPDHPDMRTQPPIRTWSGDRAVPSFFCMHPCQRPLDGPPPKGKPDGWDPKDSESVACGKQQPYEPKEDEVKYACGGLQMKGPSESFCNELNTNGTEGGLCQDLNNWIYILWQKPQEDCLDPNPDSQGNHPKIGTVMLYEKGKCGFKEEVLKEKEGREAPGTILDPDGKPIPNPDAISGGGFSIQGYYECCSDAPIDSKLNCRTCIGKDCRIFPLQQTVIINDAWVAVDSKNGPFPNDVCYQSNHTENHRLQTESRKYISYFRDYNQASYERADLKTNVPKDVNKMEKIPVACYGMYDYTQHQEHIDPDPKIDSRVPEDAKTNKIREEDKRCTIGAYYPSVNFTKDDLERKETQKGKGKFRMENVDDDPFKDPKRPFDPDKSIWYTQLTNAFSMLNEKAYKKLFDDPKNLTFALLATDTVTERAQTQVDKERRLSSGALVRAFDDTVTYDRQPERTTRTVDEWWQWVETQMHRAITPPTVRMLIPTTWSTDLDALDPLFIAPAPTTKPQTDPRSETVEVQVSAREDLLGDVAGFLERAKLLRVKEEVIPIVVPTGTSTTELRAISQGWDSWADQQEDAGRPGAGSARDVAKKLRKYADAIDQARVLRSELPKYAGALLDEQQKIGKNIADWLQQNTKAYTSQLSAYDQIGQLQVMWQAVQGVYGKLGDQDAFPWCRNSRFTAPLYSLLDPWLPGREKQGDTTAGLKPLVPCINAARDFDTCTDAGSSVLNCANTFLPGFANCIEKGKADVCLAAVPVCAITGINLLSTYAKCIAYVGKGRAKYPNSFQGHVCDQYIPQPPLFPELSFKRDPDLVLDFTPFREAIPPVSIPVLKPVQIRIKLQEIDPPGLERTTEPTAYPDLPDFPELPTSIADAVTGNLPKLGPPLSKAHALDELGGANPFPSIPAPTVDTWKIEAFLIKAKQLIIDMSNEYAKFWKSLTLKMCEGGATSGYVKPGTEQDCVRPGNDPKEKCVHFEADLKERLQRIGARPGVFLKDDLDSRGYFREPVVHGQEYCEKQDWACQLLNSYKRHQRTGWLVNIDDQEALQTMIDTLRKDIREGTQNTQKNGKKFPYDMPQEEMLRNFQVAPPIPVDRHVNLVSP